MSHRRRRRRRRRRNKNYWYDGRQANHWTTQTSCLEILGHLKEKQEESVVMLFSALATLLVPVLAADVVVPVGRMEKDRATQDTPQKDSRDPHHQPSYPEHPFFDYQESSNVTALLGKTALLNCRVKNIGNKTVSWIRHRDVHLLAVGTFTYTSDDRFTARHSPASQDWLLMIHYLQERDAGLYECQISTTPPQSHLIHLSVVEPETVIAGGPDVYINTGSRLTLTCSVLHSPEPPAFMFWYHDSKLVSYERTRGSGMEVSTERGSVTTSTLLVEDTRPKHSGRYTCDPANSRRRSVTVHVIAGDQPAAIVHDNSGGKLSLHPFLHLHLLLPLHLLLSFLHSLLPQLSVPSTQY